jgi:hypothetical protein
MVEHHELRDIEDLRPAEYNPRTITEKAAHGLGQSIASFGDLSGIVWNKRTGNMVCGHQRLDQLKAKGGQLVRGAIEVASGDRFPVRVVDWDEAKEKAANVTANNPRIAGEFTEGIADLLPEIRCSVGDEEFEALNLDSLADSLGELANPPADVVEDEVPEPPKTPITKMGDVWTLGDHRVVCGDFADCPPQTTAAETFGFTSPPYNAGDNSLGGNKSMVSSKYNHDDDNKTADEYLAFLRRMSSWLASASSCYMVNIQPLAGNKVPMHQWLGEFADHIADRMIWFKGHGQPAAAARVVNSRFEDLLIFSSSNRPSRALPFATFHGTVSNVYEGRGASGENVTKSTHAATMPISFLSHTGRPGQAFFRY